MYDHTFGVNRNPALDEAYLHIAGKSFPLVSYEIEYSTGDMGRIHAEGIMGTNFVPSRSKEVEMNTKAGTYREEIFKKMIEDRNMDCDKACDSSEANGLTQEYNNLQLDESRQKLVKHRLMRADGSLTERGKEFLLNYLARENEDDLAEAVEEVEEARKGKHCGDC